jgi:two-component system CheB/CheR fusion protein
MTNGSTQAVDVTVQRLPEPRELRGTVLIALVEAPAAVEPPQTEGLALPKGTTPRIADLQRELQHARDEVQTTREEMQTSQEELKSTNEELQSTNEELQSTNEELTTSKEEMQSMNEELQTVNHELQSKVDELSRANNDMKNLLNSTDIATLFLDGDLLVRRFTTPTASIIKLIPSDAGRPITDIAREIEYPELTADTREVLRTLVFKERLVAGTHNRWFSVRIMPYRTLENVIDGVVITFTDASTTKKLEAMLRDQASELRQVVESLPQLVWGCRPDGGCDYVSPQWVDYTGATAPELQGNGWFLAIHPDERESVRDAWRSALKAGKRLDLEQRLRAKDGTFRWFNLRCTPIRDGSGKITKWYGINSDIHALKAAVEQRKEAADGLASLLGHIAEPFLALADGETISYANSHALRLFGPTHKELVGKRLTDLLSDEEGTHILNTIRHVTKEGREKVLDAHFKQLENGGTLKLRVFPTSGGIAILFQRRAVDRSARGSDGTTTER